MNHTLNILSIEVSNVCSSNRITYISIYSNMNSLSRYSAVSPPKILLLCIPLAWYAEGHPLRAGTSNVSVRA